MDIVDIGEIVERCKSGDKEAWTMLIQAYSKPVYNIALNFIGDRELASDLMQEIFIKIYHNIDKFKDNKSFTAWVYAVSRNMCIDYWRKNKKHIHVEEIQENIAAINCSPEDETLKESEVNQLRTLLLKLDPEHRIYLTMRDILNMSYIQIAEKMNIPEGTVKSKINRARVKLSQLYLQGVR